MQPSQSAGSSYFSPAFVQEASDGLVNWCSLPLEWLQEPSLWGLSQASSAEVYRLCWSGTMLAVPAPPWGAIARLHVDASENVLMIKALRGFQSRTGRLSQAQVQAFREVLGKVHFWTAEPLGRTGLDGAMWIIEAANGGDYHVTARWSPRSGDYWEVFRFVFSELADMPDLFARFY